jgi:predicted dithiol-disulfide oxidoreductase (DUF899 family)
MNDRSHINASPEYRQQRAELLEKETLLRDQIEAVAELRRALPPGPTIEYTLDTVNGPARLIDLFEDHQTLVVYHFMYGPEATSGCPMCSSWIDGLNGVAAHLLQHVGLLVVGKAPIQNLTTWANKRGWDRLRLASSGQTTFNEDLGVEDTNGNQYPAMSVFTRNGQGVQHRYTSVAFLADGQGRGIDQMSPIWNTFDLTPQGRPNWWPSNDYPTKRTTQ